MTDKTPLLISDKDCRMALRITLAMAIKGLSFKAASKASLNQPQLGTLPQSFPILVIGLEAAAGWVAALDLLEKASPNPSLFPNGNCGMPIALSFWSEHGAAKTAQGKGFAPYADLIARQISDGRHFLQGDAPGLADIESYIAVEKAPEKDLPDMVFAWRRRITKLKNSVSCQPVDNSEAKNRLGTVNDIAVSPVDLDR